MKESKMSVSDNENGFDQNDSEDENDIEIEAFHENSGNNRTIEKPTEIHDDDHISFLPNIYGILFVVSMFQEQIIPALLILMIVLQKDIKLDVLKK